MVLKTRILLCGIVAVLSISAICVASGNLQLLEAVKKQNKAAVRALLQQHADVNAATEEGTTALAWAAHRDDLEAADLLINAGANVNTADDLGVTPLAIACQNGSDAMAEKLMKAGANPKATLQTGETALMTCTRSGALEGVRLLLARGADVNARESQRGQTALMWAASRKHPEVTRLLAEHGADVNARSKQGFTPLLFAARMGDVESARILIAARADLNAIDHSGMTPLLMASASGQEDAAVLLVESGANPNASDSSGITALHYALQKGLSSIKNFRTYTKEAETYALRPNMERLVKSLLGHGANPNARFVDDPIYAGPLFGSADHTLVAGATPFILAAATGDTNLMRLLIAAGADSMARTKTGATALMVAAVEGSVGSRTIHLRERNPEQDRKQLEAVKLAVELGIDVNAKDEWGQTAMHFAAYQGMDDNIRFLAEKGAKVNIKDKLGMTPLSIAMGIVPEDLPAELEPKHPRSPRASTVELMKKLSAAETLAQQPSAQ